MSRYAAASRCGRSTYGLIDSKSRRCGVFDGGLQWTWSIKTEPGEGFNQVGEREPNPKMKMPSRGRASRRGLDLHSGAGVGA